MPTHCSVGAVEALMRSQIRLLGNLLMLKACSAVALPTSNHLVPIGEPVSHTHTRAFRNLTAPHTAPAPDPERFQNGSVDRR